MLSAERAGTPAWGSKDVKKSFTKKETNIPVRGLFVFF